MIRQCLQSCEQSCLKKDKKLMVVWRKGSLYDLIRKAGKGQNFYSGRRITRNMNLIVSAFCIFLKMANVIVGNTKGLVVFFSGQKHKKNFTLRVLQIEHIYINDTS
jgi:hypothetical protein